MVKARTSREALHNEPLFPGNGAKKLDHSKESNVSFNIYKLGNAIGSDCKRTILSSSIFEVDPQGILVQCFERSNHNLSKG